MIDVAFGLDRDGDRRARADLLEGQHLVAIDAHAVGRLVGFRPPFHQSHGETGRGAFRVGEVVGVAQQERPALAGVVEMPEIRLAVLEQDRGLALGPKQWQRVRVEVAGHEDPERGGHGDPLEAPTEPTPGNTDAITLGVVEVHR